MDINLVVDIISNVGFPIAACVMIGWLFYREQELHKEESKLLADAIASLTTAIHELKERLNA